MSRVVVENAIMNSPFDEPSRHFRFSNEGMANESEPTANPIAVLLPKPLSGELRVPAAQLVQARP